MIPDTSWMVDAECNVRHPIADFWFSPANQKKEGHVQRAQRVAQALSICDECPVKLKCYEVGLDEKHGIWGGVDRTTYRTN